MDLVQCMIPLFTMQLMLHGLIVMVVTCFHMLKIASSGEIYLLLEETTSIKQVIASAKFDPCDDKPWHVISNNVVFYMCRLRRASAASC